MGFLPFESICEHILLYKEKKQAFHLFPSMCAS